MTKEEIMAKIAQDKVHCAKVAPFIPNGAAIRGKGKQFIAPSQRGKLAYFSVASFRKMWQGIEVTASLIKKEADAGLNVGFYAWVNYILNTNKNVGEVTNMFSTFASTLVWAARALKGDVAGMKDAVTVFKAIWPECKEGTKIYESPLGAACKDGDNFLVTEIDENQAQKVFDATAGMALTAENILAASQDLIACGRFYQELTIDAAKKGTQIEIPRVERLQAVKALSRNAVHAELDFEQRVCNINAAVCETISKVKTSKPLVYNEQKGRYERAKEEKTVLDTEKREIIEVSLHDIYNDIRQVGVESVKELGSALMMCGERELPAHVANAVNAFGVGDDFKNAEYLEVVKLFKSMYDRLAASFAADDAKLREMKKNELDYESAKSILKQQKKSCYMAVRNSLRQGLKGLDPVQCQTAVLKASMMEQADKQKKNPNEKIGIGSFVDAALDAEKLLWTMNVALKDSDKVARVARTYLDECNLEEGSVVRFDETGYAVCGDKTAFSMELAGSDVDVTIHYDEFGKAYAEASIESLVKVPEADKNEICFMTKANAAVKEFLVNCQGEELTLVPFKKVGGRVIRDAVLDKNGNVVTSFICSVMGGKASKRLNNLYNNRKGTIKMARLLKFGNKQYAFVVLGNVAKIEGEEAPVPTAPKKAVKMSLASYFKTTKVEEPKEEVAPKKFSVADYFASKTFKKH